MLVKVTAQTVPSFRALCEHVKILLGPACAEHVRAVVLGPMQKGSAAAAENMAALAARTRELAQLDHLLVLDILSVQTAVDHLKRYCCKGTYPQEVLDQFTLPLIRTGVFDRIYMRETWPTSVGATQEHWVAVGCGVFIEYVP